MTPLELGLLGLAAITIDRSRTGPAANTDAPSSAAVTVTGYVQGQAFQLTVAKIDDDGHALRVDAADAFLSMRDAAAAAGVELLVASAFRTWEEQDRLYQGWLKKLPGFNLAAPPGWSNHQNGIDVDLNTHVPAVFAWLNANADSCGFRRTVTSEPWHWEFSA